VCFEISTELLWCRVNFQPIIWLEKNSSRLSQNKRRNFDGVSYTYTQNHPLQPFLFVLGCVSGFFLSCCIQRKLFALGRRRALFWINFRLNFRIFNRFCRGSQSYWIRWEHTEIDSKQSIWVFMSDHGDGGDQCCCDLCRNNIQLFDVGTRILFHSKKTGYSCTSQRDQ
jgi:hypothetical protein